MNKKRKLKDATLLAHLAEDRSAHMGAVVPPIFQNSLFTFESWDDIDNAFSNRTSVPLYSRGINPTVSIAEAKIAQLARGEKAKLFGSGMAAITAAVMSCVSAGDHIIAVKNIYGPANNLISSYLRRKMGIEVTFVDGADASDFEDGLKSNTKLFYLESPSTALFTLQDLDAVSRIAKRNKIRTVMDNSWATPVFQKPLSSGIDLEVHTCSKYLGGHSDLLAGVVIGNEDDISTLAVEEGELLGGICSPLTAWLLIRSLRTLLLRMNAHQESALRLATYLSKHDKVIAVHYPGLKDHPQFDLGKRQMTGYSGLLSFELATSDLAAIKRFVNSLELFQIGVSWGGHESLVYAPAIGYLKEFSEDKFAEMNISKGLIRISVGLEDAGDLRDDLDQALAKI